MNLASWLKRRAPESGRIRELTDLESPLAAEALAIYTDSFPEEERDPLGEIAEAVHAPVTPAGINHFRVLVEDRHVAGLAIFSTYHEQYMGFLKFIAVRRDLRGQGHGSELLRDAVQQVRQDGLRAKGWPYLGLVLEVERPETAQGDQDRAVRERRIRFYQRHGATRLRSVDLIAPPVADDEPMMAYHLLFIRAVPKYGINWWLRRATVNAVLVQGYGEAPDSWYVKHALGRA